VSTLQTTNIKNPSSASNNIVLASSGATTIGGNTFPTTTGTNGQFLQTNGSGTISWATVASPAVALTAATSVASTSGTSIDFTSIPSGVKRVTVMFNGVSTSGTSAILIQLGTSSGVTTSGYTSTGQGFSPAGGLGATTSTAGVLTMDAALAAGNLDGNWQICNQTSNTWVVNGVGNRGAGGYSCFGAGRVALSATLDRVRVTTVNGTDTFDAGSINILYEG
jgi:hypothetical protein